MWSVMDGAMLSAKIKHDNRWNKELMTTLKEPQEAEQTFGLWKDSNY